MKDRRAPADGDKVTVWLSLAHYEPPPNPEMKAARLGADSLCNAQPPSPGSWEQITLSLQGVKWC